MTYTLTVTVNPTSVAQINAARQFVTVVQSVQSYVASMPMSSMLSSTFATTPSLEVAWLAFSPFPSNTITWSPAYSLYATLAAPVNGVVIQPVATQPAQQRLTYPFLNNGFGAPVSADMDGYFVQNLQGSMTFGLALTATVNAVAQAVAPINSSTVLNNQTGWFTPQTSVAVFLSTTSANGTAFYQFGTPTFYSMSKNTVSLTYQASNSTFVEGT